MPMKKFSRIEICLVLLALACLVPTTVYAGDAATFKSLYKASTALMWGVAAIAAIGAGALVYFSAGAASPAVAGAGTWVGGLMGYSGVAATNAGLALLGGGSLATGGFGILGGAALLTAALSFGSGIATDSVIERMDVESKYSYSEFSKHSKNMLTLPIPVNKSGPHSYKLALQALKKAKHDESSSSDFNQNVIQEAINTLRSVNDTNATEEEIARKQSLLALLQFLRNNYREAKVSALDAIAHTEAPKAPGKIERFMNGLKMKAIEGGLPVSDLKAVKAQNPVPAYIYGVSLLYDENINEEESISFFLNSINAEPDNPLSPYLFAIYLDRAMYRLNDGSFSIRSLEKVANVAMGLEYDERKCVIQLGLLNRYFIRLWAESETIMALTTTENRSIHRSPSTLRSAKASLVRYKQLVHFLSPTLDAQSKILKSHLNARPGVIKKMWSSGVEDWELKWNSDIEEKMKRLKSYMDNIDTLNQRINELEEFQLKLANEMLPTKILAASDLS